MCLQSNNNILKEMININFLMHVLIEKVCLVKKMLQPENTY